MTDLVIGKPVDEAMAIHEEFLDLMQGRGQVEPDEEVLEDGDRVRRRRQVPGPRQVRAAVLDGLEGRDRRRPSPERREGVTMTDQHRPTTSDLPEVDLHRRPLAPATPTRSTTSPRR